MNFLVCAILINYYYYNQNSSGTARAKYLLPDQNLTEYLIRNYQYIKYEI